MEDSFTGLTYEQHAKAILIITNLYGQAAGSILVENPELRAKLRTVQVPPAKVLSLMRFYARLGLFETEDNKKFVLTPLLAEIAALAPDQQNECVARLLGSEEETLVNRAEANSSESMADTRPARHETTVENDAGEVVPPTGEADTVATEVTVNRRPDYAPPPAPETPQTFVPTQTEPAGEEDMEAEPIPVARPGQGRRRQTVKFDRNYQAPSVENMLYGTSAEQNTAPPEQKPEAPQLPDNDVPTHTAPADGDLPGPRRTPTIPRTANIQDDNREPAPSPSPVPQHRSRLSARETDLSVNQNRPVSRSPAPKPGQDRATPPAPLPASGGRPSLTERRAAARQLLEGRPSSSEQTTVSQIQVEEGSVNVQIQLNVDVPAQADEETMRSLGRRIRLILQEAGLDETYVRVKIQAMLNEAGLGDSEIHIEESDS